MTNKLTQYDINFMDRGTTSVIRGLAILGIVLHHLMHLALQVLYLGKAVTL